MIPRRLELENFLSYRDRVSLDFSGVHLACISGANGAGKSSILDAMTWALFGRSRSKSDDDVVNRRAALSQRAAEVRFDFHLDGADYRIIRRKKVGRTMVLEFQIRSADQEWKSLSEGRLRETQRVVESLLHMNFDTFINASFFLQGQADEFTTKTANKRKEILADLLGVSEWEEHKARVTARRREVEDQLLLMDGRLHDIEQELTERPEREAALAEATRQVASIKETLVLQEKILEQQREAEAYLRQQRQAVSNLADSYERAADALEASEDTFARRQRERQDYQAILDDSESIVADFAAWQEAEHLVQEWQGKAERFHALQNEMKPHELTIERERSRLLQRLEELDEQSRHVSEMAKERQELEEQLGVDKSRLQETMRHLAKYSEAEQQFHRAQTELQRLEADRRLAEQEKNQLEGQKRRVAEQIDDREALEGTIQEGEIEIGAIQDQLDKVAQDNQELMKAMSDRDTLKNEQVTLRQEMDKIKERLSRLQEEEGELCPLCGQELSESHRQTVVADLESQGAAKGSRFRSNKSRLEGLIDRISSLSDSVKGRGSLERKLHAQQVRVEKAKARLEEISRAVAEWEAQGAGRLTDLVDQLADQTKLDAIQAQVDRLDELVKEKSDFEEKYRELQENIPRLETRLAEIERQVIAWRGDPEAGLDGLQATHEAIRRQLENDQVAEEAQKSLGKLKIKVSSLGYDPNAHQEAVKARDQLAEAQERYQTLRRAETAVMTMNSALEDLEAQIAGQRKAAAEIEEQLAVAKKNLDDLESKSFDVDELEEKVSALRERQILAHQVLATAQQSVDVLDDLSQQREQITGKRQEITQRIQRLKMLEKACGREGVQALLIERALPEIEDDANDLLSRLSDGKMSLIFETQRQLKTRDSLAETLDIRIVDNSGERPYENYSGGEQFRVNFAIRLALSKILTRRAGARLQTLVIDEGFGSQDPQGRQRLIESINAIQTEFEKILVITHIDELRDAFPTRIEVEKGPGGSTATII